MKSRALRQSKTLSIVAGGILYAEDASHIRQSTTVIGVDRGALWLIDHNILPDIAIGDFDSVSAKERKIIQQHAKKFLKFSPEKDATDLELAVNASIDLKPTCVTIYGGLGSRFDHSLGAAHMLVKLSSHNIYGEIVDKYNKISIVRRQRQIVKDNRYRYVSVLPFGRDVTVTLQGFAYDISGYVLPVGSTRGISNEIMQTDARILVHDGLVLLIQSSDRTFLG